MTDPIAEQIALAQKAAAAHTAAQAAPLSASTPPAVASTQTNVPAMPATPTRRLSDEDMMVGGVSVDMWFKPKEFGIQFGTSAELVPTFVGLLNLDERALNFAIKWGVSPNINYRKTYDGVTCASGGTWEQAIAIAKSVDPNARPYNSVDLPFTVYEDVKAPSGTTLCEKGKRVGYATSTTNWQNWESFYAQCKAAGYVPNGGSDPDKRVAIVEVGFQRRQKGNNAWGVATFKFIGWAPDPNSVE